MFNRLALTLCIISTLSCGGKIQNIDLSSSDSEDQNSGTHKLMYVSRSEPSAAIVVFQINTNGTLTEKSSISIDSTPHGLAICQNKYLYATDMETPGKIYSFKIDSQTGLLTSLGNQSLGLNGFSERILYVNPEASHFILVNDYNNDLIDVWSINMNTGNITKINTHNIETSCNPAQMLANSTKDKFYVACQNASPNDRVEGYAIDDAGNITPLPGSPYIMPATSAPYGLSFSKDYNSLYVGLSWSGAVAGYPVDSNGDLGVPITGSPYSNNSSFTLNLWVSPDNKHLYNTDCQDTTDSVVKLNIGSEGNLSNPVTQLGERASYITGDDSGVYVYVTKKLAGLQPFLRNQSTGQLISNGPLISGTYGKMIISPWRF